MGQAQYEAAQNAHTQFAGWCFQQAVNGLCLLSSCLASLSCSNNMVIASALGPVANVVPTPLLITRLRYPDSRQPYPGSGYPKCAISHHPSYPALEYHRPGGKQFNSFGSGGKAYVSPPGSGILLGRIVYRRYHALFSRVSACHRLLSCSAPAF